jgi:hypothetical protein
MPLLRPGTVSMKLVLGTIPSQLNTRPMRLTKRTMGVTR